MAELDVNRYLQPVSDDLPCGENLEYDPLLREIEEAAEGTPERVVGESVLPGEDPDWRVVRRKAFDAMERTRDVQIALYLLRALLNLEGLPGLSQGLQLVRGLLDRFWDCVHPVQDEDDDYPVLRINLLTSLADRDSFINPLRAVPLTDSQVMGRYSLRDLELSKMDPGEGDEAEIPKASQIDAAFMDTAVEALEENARSVDVALGEVQAMNTLLQDKVGAVNAPDLSLLVHTLKELQSIFQEQLQRRGVGEETSTLVDDAEVNTAAGGEVRGQLMSAGVHSREDVQKAIDAIIDYYRTHEPSSPVPIMLKRVRRMVFMDFREILMELAPDGVNQANVVFGPDENAEE